MKLKTIILLITFASLFSCQKDETPWIDFFWQSSKMGSQTYDKAGMFINYHLNGSKSQFSSQFDTGSFGFLDEELIFALASFDSKIANQINKDTVTETIINGKRISRILSDVTYNFGDIDIAQKNVSLMPSKSIRLTRNGFESNYNTPMGTIGAQFCVGKVILIDYPNERLARLDSIPASYLIQKSIPFKINAQNWVLLPFQIDQNSYYVVFDTGSSIFPFLTSERTFWERYGELQSQSDTLQVSSFGKIFDTYEATFINAPTKGLDLRNQNIYLTTRPLKTQYVDSIPIIGITGNKLFLDKTIAIDYKNKLFHILRK